jgi:hypothetical protein
MIIVCTTAGVITAAERLCRSAAIAAMGEGLDVALKPTSPLRIQIADHPCVEGPQLWYSVGENNNQYGWICDFEVDGAPLYVDLDDLGDSCPYSQSHTREFCGRASCREA